MARQITIGQLAELTGVSAKAIRYYESIGVIPRPQRSQARYRMYSDIDIRRLNLVRRARTLDMGLPEVKQLVAWASTGSCNNFQERFQEVVREQMDEVERRISDLQRLREDLQLVEARLTVSRSDADSDKSALECCQESCACLEDRIEGSNQLQERK